MSDANTDLNRPTYLGEKLVNQEDSPFKGFTAVDWAMHYILRYGQIDGSHHKTWVLDQVIRILNGTPIILKLAKWDDGQEEYRFITGKPSKEYKAWVRHSKKGGYDYDEGIAP